MILERIVEEKRKEVEYLKRMRPLAELKEIAVDMPPTRDFGQALRKECAIIAEIKRRSPSVGRLRADFDPITIASIYQQNGAAAVSVLTDEKFFAGSLSYLISIKNQLELPLLRKEFIIDPHQIYETRVFGGDALLLIVSILAETQLKEYIDLAGSLQLFPLVEVHCRDELDRAVGAGAKIIGINNRNLKTFATDLKTSIELLHLMPEDVTVISESGIQTRDDIEKLMKAGVHAFLIGETLMRARDMGEKLRELLGSEAAP
jgi:indole-3-glycerol phosphate synthase